MSDDQARRQAYEKTVELLKPALERVVSEPEFRARFEASPLEVLDELGIELDPVTRGELTGKRFSEFWAARKQAVEGPLEVRDLPPSELEDAGLDSVVGGATLGFSSAALVNFAPPYVPVGPSGFGDNFAPIAVRDLKKGG
jgi:hypothetical protein